MARTATEWAEIIRGCNLFVGMDTSTRKAILQATLHCGKTPTFATVYCFVQDLSWDDKLVVLTSAVEAFSDGELPDFVSKLGGKGSKFDTFCCRLVSGHLCVCNNLSRGLHAVVC